MIGKAFAAAWLGLLLLCGMAVAQSQMQSVLARGQGDHLWVVVPTVGPDKVAYTSVRQLTDPVAGGWVETNHLSNAVIDAAPLGDRLAVLEADGGWRILWPGDNATGSPPPGDRKLVGLTSEGETLWAIAQHKDGIGEVLRWTERDGWSIVAPLPADVKPADASLAVFNQTPWLTWTDQHTARLARWTGGREWKPSPRTWTGVERAELVPGMPYPLLAGRQLVKGKPNSQFSFVRIGIESDPTPGIPKGLPADNADVTYAGSSLRVIELRDGKLQQTLIDGFGRGVRYGPTPIADPARPQPPTSSEWANVVLMTILTMFMLRALRADSAGMPAVAEGLQIASLWRRLLAGVIDALPLLLAMGWVAWRFKGTFEELYVATEDSALPFTLIVPSYVGLFVYVGHVMVSEICWGRSLGKRLMGLRVVTIEGDPAPAGKIVLRNVLRVLELALVLPAVFPLFLPTRQRLGDLAAGTVVVSGHLKRQNRDESGQE